MFSTELRNVWPMLPASCLLVVLLVCCPVSSARLLGYVDLDGDGFDNNAPDTDLDGIPDEFEAHGFVSTQIDGLQAAPMFAGQAPAADAQLKAGEIFGRRKFTTRGIAENRRDFDIGFGSGLGLGAGLGGGGACAGGICF